MSSVVSDPFVIPWTVLHQVPLSVEFSRREYWSGFPFPSPRNLPDPGIEPGFPVLQADSLPTELQLKPRISLYTMLIILFRITHEVTKSTVVVVQSLMCLTL